MQSPKIVAINVLITFLEGFAAAWALTNNEVSQHALLGAGAAGISLVWNVVVKPYLKSRGILYKKV